MVQSSKAMHEAVIRISSDMARMSATLDEPEVYVCLQPLIIIYGPPRYADTPEGQAMSNFWLATYTKALRGVPREALQAAVDEYIRTGPPKYRQKAWNFPEPSDLVTLAKPTMQRVLALAWAVKQAAAAPKKVDRNSPEHEAEREKVREMMREAGALRPDGTVDATALLRPRGVHGHRPSQSPQQVADGLRASVGVSD